MQRAEPGEKSRLSLGSVLILLTVATTPWTGAKVWGVNLCDLLLIASGAIVILEAGGGYRRVAIRWWMALPTLTAFFIYAADVIVRGSSAEARTATNANVSGTTAFAEAEGGGLFVARIAMATLLVAIVVCSEVWTYGRTRAVLIVRFWTMGVLISAIAAVTDALGLTSASDLIFHQISGDRALGLAFQPNSLAQTIALGLPMMFFFLTVAMTGMRRLFWLVAVAASVTALVLSNSRGGLIVGLIGVAICIWLLFIRHRGGRILLFTLLVPLVGVAYAAVDWVTENTRLGGGGGAALSDAGRWDLIRRGVEAFLSNPVFGAGIGGGAGVMVPLLVLSSGGLVLLLGYYSFIFATYFKVLRATADGFVAFCAISITALLAMGMFNNSVNERYDFVVVAVAAATIQPLAETRSRIPRSRTARLAHA